MTFEVLAHAARALRDMCPEMVVSEMYVNMDGDLVFHTVDKQELLYRIKKQTLYRYHKGWLHSYLERVDA